MGVSLRCEAAGHADVALCSTCSLPLNFLHAVSHAVPSTLKQESWYHAVPPLCNCGCPCHASLKTVQRTSHWPSEPCHCFRNMQRDASLLCLTAFLLPAHTPLACRQDTGDAPACVQHLDAPADSHPGALLSACWQVPGPLCWPGLPGALHHGMSVGPDHHAAASRAGAKWLPGTQAMRSICGRARDILRHSRASRFGKSVL